MENKKGSSSAKQLQKPEYLSMAMVKRNQTKWMTQEPLICNPQKFVLNPNIVFADLEESDQPDQQKTTPEFT